MRWWDGAVWWWDGGVRQSSVFIGRAPLKFHVTRSLMRVGTPWYRLWRLRRLSAWLEIRHGLLACHCPARGPPNSRNRQSTVHVSRRVARRSFGNQRTHTLSALSMEKLYLKRVLRLLTVDQKQQRVDDSEHCLDVYERNKKNFFMLYVTMDETWINYYILE